MSRNGLLTFRIIEVILLVIAACMAFFRIEGSPIVGLITVVFGIIWVIQEYQVSMDKADIQPKSCAYIILAITLLLFGLNYHPADYLLKIADVISMLAAICLSIWILVNKHKSKNA